MSNQVTPVSTQSTVAFFSKILKGYDGCNFRIELWDGTGIEARPGSASLFSIRFNHPGALRGLFFPPSEVKICEAYFNNEFDITGDILALLNNAQKLGAHNWKPSQLFSLFSTIVKLPRGKTGGIVNENQRDISGEKYSINRDREAVQYHYDVSDDFYALWLDERMIYSGAYFHDEEESVTQAQINKLDIICKKLELKKDETFLDIGCGWGALLLYAAEHYGVKASGVTLSKNQAEYIRRKAIEKGIGDRVSIELKDYRELSTDKKFDKLASVEMLHHVGEKNLPEFFTHLKALLNDNGLSFHLAITSNPSKGKYRGPKYADKYFMPDYQLVPVSKYLEYAEKAGWEVIDNENLRKHYQLTAERWLHTLEEKHDDAARISGEVIFRVWRLSLALMAYGFQKNMIQMHHFVLAKNPRGEYHNPLTRMGWYK